MARRNKRWLLAALLLTGCVPQAQEMPAEPPAQAEIIELTPAETPTPTASATQAPDMLFEDDGDIYFSDAYKAAFSATTYTFDHVPRVLIYHTHAREAFREAAAEDASATGQPGGKPGRSAATADPRATPTATPTYRSDDPDETVVYLGELLEKELTARGFVVFHDTTDVESPSLSTAYARSLAVMQSYADIDLYIDLHRNAANVERSKNDVAMIDGERVARMFFVVGTGLTASDASGELPNWRENYTLALSLGERLAAVDAALVKDVRVKQKAYNQQTGLCLLAEIGHNANLLSEAARTIPYLADALGAVFRFS